MRTLVLALALLVCASGAARAQFLAPSPYLSFSMSPFAGMSFRYFHLETFEDALFNTPGATGTGTVVGPGGNTDSVDADDGAIDGSGTNGRAYFRLGNATGASVAFTFDAAILGAFPTHVGIVWTDGSGVVTFSAYDASGTLLGTSTGPIPGIPGSHNGQTSEDTFFGVIHEGGISRIEVRNVLPGTPTGIEVDHLQYGLVPEPQTYALLLAGLGLLGFAVGRRPMQLAL